MADGFICFHISQRNAWGIAFCIAAGGFILNMAGAALATVLSEAIAAVLCIIYAFQKIPQFRQVFVLRKIKMELIVETLKVGIPTGL